MSSHDRSVYAQGDVAWQDVDGEVILLDPSGAKILGLNRTGGVVWKLLDGKRCLGDIAHAMAQQFALTQNAAIADTLSFIDSLAERNLVRDVSH